jgi:hypothetical protein
MEKEKVGVSDSASVLITSVRSSSIGALTKSKPSVSAKVEASASGSSSMTNPMQHANTAPAIIAAWDNAPDDNARLALEQTALAHGTTAVRVEALLKRDARSRAEMATLQAALNTATAAVNTANANAAAAQAVAANASAFTSEDSFANSRDPNGHDRGVSVQSRRAWVDFVTARDRSGRRSVPVPDRTVRSVNRTGLNF